MTRGEMLTLLNDTLADHNEVISEARKVLALNVAARYVGRELRRYDLDSRAATYDEFTTTATRDYELVATTVGRIFRIARMDGDDHVFDLTIVRQNEIHGAYRENEWRVYLTRDQGDGSTDPLWSVHFHFDPPTGIVCRAYFTVAQTDIAIDAGGGVQDALSFTYIPEDYHELVVARAAYKLTGPDDSNRPFAEADYRELMLQLQRDAPASRIVQE